MNTLLEAIQEYPEQFISTCSARANTTPSVKNRVNHYFMEYYIKLGMWEGVTELLKDSSYRKPLEGVVYCLDSYSEIDNNVWHQIVDLFNEGKIV